MFWKPRSIFILREFTYQFKPVLLRKDGKVEFVKNKQTPNNNKKHVPGTCAQHVHWAEWVLRSGRPASSLQLPLASSLWGSHGVRVGMEERSGSLSAQLQPS